MTPFIINKMGVKEVRGSGEHGEEHTQRKDEYAEEQQRAEGEGGMTVRGGKGVQGGNWSSAEAVGSVSVCSHFNLYLAHFREE